MNSVFLKRAAKIRTIFKSPNFFHFFFILLHPKSETEMGNEKESTLQDASLLQLFLVFAKIGAFTIGGGFAMISLIQDELVKRRWLSENEFSELLTLAQTAPGLLAVNMSIFTGFRLKGVKGSIVATIGSILPPFLIILAVAVIFSDFQDNPAVLRIFKGIRPVVVALIMVPMINMVRKNNDCWWKWLLTAASLGAVSFLGISPVYVLIIVIVLFIAIALYKERDMKTKDND